MIIFLFPLIYKVLTEVGALGLATYGREDCYVKLIKVHDATCPSNAQTVEEELNRFYSSAVVNWHVSIGETITEDELPNLNYDDFLTGNVDMVSSYTSVMRRICKYYKRTYGNDKNTLYLFFINHPNPDKAGFMPVAGDHGFIFNFGEDYRTNYEILAHELAHGAFNLRHPFSPKSTYQLPRGSTDNLMDYGVPEQGTGLWKYQWDLIHNPENVLLAHAESEEEGAFEIMTHQNLIAEAITKIDGSLVLNERNFKLLVSTGLLADGGSILCDINREMSNAELTEGFSTYLNSKLDDLYRIYNSPMNVVKEQWMEFWSTSIEFPNMRNAFRRSWQYGKEMKQSAELIAEYGKAIYSSNVKFDKLVITPNNKFKMELKNLTLLEDPDLCFNLLFQMQDYVTVYDSIKSLSLNGQGIDLIPEWMSTDVNVSTQNSLGIKYVNKETQKELFEITFDVNASLVNSVELVMSLNDVPVNFPLTCESERIEIHFDNKIDGGAVINEWAKLDQKLDDIKSLEENGAIDLGLVLHNVADFYAHSNFITEYIDWWMEQPGTDIRTLKPEDIPTYVDVVTGASNEWNLDWNAFWNYYKNKMFTGTWDLGLMLKDESEREKLPTPYHDDMALDSSESTEGGNKPDKSALYNYFQYARGAAYKHIYEILKEKLK